MSTVHADDSPSRALAAPDVESGTAHWVQQLRHEHSSRRAEVPPERRRLMIAMVKDAIRCIEKHRHADSSGGREMFARAAQWILSEETDWLYAFVRICETLDVDPNAVRVSLGLAAARGDAASPSRCSVQSRA